jgi:hypothetical protein
MSHAAEELPEELWVQILHHVYYSQRLTNSALVCRKLARAAAAATQSLGPLSYSDSLNTWISNHGSSLTRLSLGDFDQGHITIRQLPCPNLAELVVFGLRVQLCAGSEHMGLLHSCPALTQLLLGSVTLLDGSVDGPVPAPAARLQVFRLCARTLPAVGHNQNQALASRLLPHLASVTRICLIGCRGEQLAPWLLPHISTLVRLQELELVGLCRTGEQPGHAGCACTPPPPGLSSWTLPSQLSASVQHCHTH